MLYLLFRFWFPAVLLTVLITKYWSPRDDGPLLKKCMPLAKPKNGALLFYPEVWRIIC